MPSQLVENFPPFESWRTQLLAFRVTRRLRSGGKLLRICFRSRPNGAKTPTMRALRSVASSTPFRRPCSAAYPPSRCLSGLLQGAAYVDGVEVIPLPGPGFSRQLTFVTRREEFVTLGPRVAELTRALVRARALPRFLKLAPWLEPKMEWMMFKPDNITA